MARKDLHAQRPEAGRPRCDDPTRPPKIEREQEGKYSILKLIFVCFSNEKQKKWRETEKMEIVENV